MRRAQSVRHYSRPSLALGADDLGVLREGDESNEDVLRRQLLDKDRECDRLETTIQALQDQLAQRPPLEHVLEVEKEYKNLELLLQGTQRENERCMSELERSRTREKNLERELVRLAGDNWQANLEMAPISANPLRGGSMMHQRSNTIASPMTYNVARHAYSPSPSPKPDGLHRISTNSPPAPHHPQQPTLAQVEQLRMLILGMEQRLEVREQKLVKTVERAEGEGRKFEALRKEMVSDT
ncbi:hypothetical protein B0H34DRAFT_791956 [Crassisporium funariophilum]|nr:hypothetical protein B0H34DRAFT_791956 [Crassisporium funariophilum]